MPKRARLTWRRWRAWHTAPQPAHCEETLRRACAECEVQCGFGIRHRLLSRAPRVLAREWGGGALRSAQALFRGKSVALHPPLTRPADWSKYDPTRTPYAYFVYEAGQITNLHARAALLEALTAHRTSERSREPVPEERRINVGFLPEVDELHGKGRRAALLRVLNAGNNELASIRNWSTTAGGRRALIRPFALSASPEWPVKTVRHSAVVVVVRRPITGTVSAALRAVKRHGFVNYFPPLPVAMREQVPPVVQGAAALQLDWRRAVDFALICRAARSARCHRALRALRDRNGLEWKGGGELFFTNAKGMLTTVGRLARDRVLFAKLWHPPEAVDFEAAWSTSVPFLSRYHSIQAVRRFLWNYCASLRLAAHGVKCVVGDLVDDGGGLRVVETPEEAAAASPYDVVLPDCPLPWHDGEVEFPLHRIDEEQWHAVLGDLGVSAERIARNKSLERMRKDCCWDGPVYRKLLCRPRNMSWRTTRGPAVDLAPGHSSAAPAGEVSEVAADGGGEGDLKVAVTADLPLHSSFDALLREAFMLDPGLEPVPAMWRLFPGGRPGTGPEGTDLEPPAPLHEEEEDEAPY
eukprot:TRINITY_DN40454_c0_g1_i1.p1 TRINITY_DN40454_c0_g1~~TRINITY_DN40454_c0_g1_i1.p1  ORF type:complete len:581 (+),score=131.19 TRINITY_DN40454_c0_g1_i1:74-1816(+)